MALPTYDKSKRKQTFQQLPKGAYVVVIKNAKEVPNKNGGGSHLEIAFDVTEGEYKGFYMSQYESNTSEDKKYNRDAYYYLNVPEDGAKQYVWDNWNTFFADLEDSNNGFVFAGDVRTLKDKVIGGKFHIEQTEYNGNIYDHTRLRYTCVADAVRSGKYGKLPNDKLITSSGPKPVPLGDPTGFMDIPEGAGEDVPW